MIPVFASFGTLVSFT